MDPIECQGLAGGYQLDRIYSNTSYMQFMERYESRKESCNNQEAALHSRGNNPLYKPVVLHLLNIT